MPYADPEKRRAYHKAYSRKWYRTAKGQKALRRYRKQPHVREAERQRASRMRRDHPEKIIARNAVNNAIRDGYLKREPCEKCGKAAHAHHDDYSKPLQVRWLCRSHHAAEHGKDIS